MSRSELGPSFPEDAKATSRLYDDTASHTYYDLNMSLIACRHPTGADFCWVARQGSLAGCARHVRVAVIDVLLCLSPT